MEYSNRLRSLFVLMAMVISLALVACAGRPVGEAGAPPDVTTFAADATPLDAVTRATQASLAGDRLGTVVRMPSGPVYVEAVIPAAPPGPVTGSADSATTARLRALLPAQFEVLQAAGQAVEVQGPADWQALLNVTLEQLAPLAPGQGAVVDILNQQELFIYRAANGTVHAISSVYKPAGIRVAQHYDFTRLLTVMGQQYLQRYGSDSLRLFETGDDSDYGYPFAFADGASGRIVFLQQALNGDGTRPGLPLGATIGLFSRTVMDHLRVALNQPVSSVARLFTLAATSTADLVRPHTLMLSGQRPVPDLNQGPGMDLAAWERRLDDITGSRLSSGQMHYLIDGDAFFTRLVDLVNQARQSVYLRVYIFDNDDYALKIADLLRQRSSDIKVKVLVDGLGTLGAGQVQPDSLPADHRPPLSLVNYLQEDSRVKVRVLSNPWLTGDHTKAIVIDERIAFIGGMNVGREYRYDWHDMMVETTGPVVGEIVADLHRAWARAGILGDLQVLFHDDGNRTVQGAEGDYPLRLLYTRPGNSQILRAQIAAMRTARQRIYLENPYLTSDAVLYELAQARLRGVDVRVIMPYRSDSGVINKSNALAANTLLRYGVRVFIYPGMSHLKAAVYDGWACVGSANFDNLSLRVNREMNLATSHAPAVTALVGQVFGPDFEHSLELTEPLPNDWSRYLAELLADLL